MIRFWFFLVCMFIGLLCGIVSAGRQGGAAHNTPQRFYQPFKESMLLYGSYRIVRTRRIETAGGRQEKSAHFLIKHNNQTE